MVVTCSEIGVVFECAHLAERGACVVKVGSVQQRECELNYNSAALCSDTRGRQLTSKLIGVLQIHQSSFPTWFRSLLIGRMGTQCRMCSGRAVVLEHIRVKGDDGA